MVPGVCLTDKTSWQHLIFMIFIYQLLPYDSLRKLICYKEKSGNQFLLNITLHIADNENIPRS